MGIKRRIIPILGDLQLPTILKTLGINFSDTDTILTRKEGYGKDMGDILISCHMKTKFGIAADC